MQLLRIEINVSLTVQGIITDVDETIKLNNKQPLIL
jgi:hypothetical protein